ncbi:MAG: SLBB domain-containing protein, partial [Candidatus Krumholzibacteriota bacterium]
MTFNYKLRRVLTLSLPAVALFVVGLVLLAPVVVSAQGITPEMLEEASRRTGLSKEQLLRQYQQGTDQPAAAADTAQAPVPGRTSLEGIDDTVPWRDTDVQVTLPMSDVVGYEESPGLVEEDLQGNDPDTFFGSDFFRLDAGVFQPPSFGPVPDDYRLGVGDEVIINVWGGVDLQLTRVVDRDGSVILPTVGKITCAGRTLKQVDESIRKRLATTHASIDVDGYDGEDDGDTFVEVTMGHLRAVRVFVIGRATRPGSYELSSASTILTALYAAGGPTDQGSFRDIRLVRGDKTVANLDLYRYLMGGGRDMDALLQEGDTVFIPERGTGVSIAGAVRRPMHYEMKDGQGLADLIGYSGGFTPTAAPGIIHIRRILPLDQRQPGQPDHVFLDVPFDVTAMAGDDGRPVPLLDGDQISVDGIEDRLDNWVRVSGAVKRPGEYEFKPGMTALDLIEAAGGLWPDALTERAVIDRTSPERQLSTVAVALDEMLSGAVAPVDLQGQDVLEVFYRWDIQERPQVTITGEVNDPVSLDFREGMTLRDLVLKAGGLRQSANLLEAEVSRLNVEALENPDTSLRPDRTVDALKVSLGSDFLTRETGFALQPHDRVAIRRLPWWEMQRTVTIRGEVFYPGVFSLERKDETISSVISRAGGLTPDAYLVGARIIRRQDGVGNIALDLMEALSKPGCQYDIVLQAGDQIVIPDRMYTVKVMGEVGFPTSLVHEKGKDINWYVNHAGGYLNKSDKKRARVVWPNGMSLPNKGGSEVVAGSTIIVPVKPPPEGKTKLETARDITAIIASL